VWDAEREVADFIAFIDSDDVFCSHLHRTFSVELLQNPGWCLKMSL